MFLFTISLVYTNLLYKVIIYIFDSIQYKNIKYNFHGNSKGEVILRLILNKSAKFIFIYLPWPPKSSALSRSHMPRLLL